MLAHAISSTIPTTIIRTVDCWTSDVGALAVRVQPRLEQRHRGGAASLVVDGERLLEIREDRLQVGARLLGGDAGLEPRDAEQEQAAARLVPRPAARRRCATSAARPTARRRAARR